MNNGFFSSVTGKNDSQEPKPFRNAVKIRENVWYVKQYDGTVKRVTVVPVTTLINASGGKRNVW